MKRYVSPKKRNKENTGLPERWRFKHGAYYYRVPDHLRKYWDNKTDFRLGKTLIEAHRAWASRAEIYADARTIGEGIERYLLEVVPEKSIRTQDGYIRLINKFILPVFHDVMITTIRPVDLYKFRDVIGRTSKHQANQCLAIMSHLYTKFIEWGLTDTHPAIGKVKKYGLKPPDRYVENWELTEFLSVASGLIKVYVPLKQLIALRKGDLLSIKKSWIKDDGLHVIQHKTGKKIVIEWTDELHSAIENINKYNAAYRKVGSVSLFYNCFGQPYVKENRYTSGFDSIWQRDMKRALNETKLETRFTEQDLRAKTSSDMPLADAVNLLDHSSEQVNKTHYQRKGKVVKPHSLNGNRG